MISEGELLKLMNLKPTELRYLRAEKGMPYVQLSRKHRVYLEEALMNEVRKNRVTSENGGKGQRQPP